jgi:hypothetical protein
MFLWAIYIFPRSVCLFCCRKIGGPIVGIYKSLTQISECGNWDWGRAVSFLGVLKLYFLCSVGLFRSTTKHLNSKNVFFNIIPQEVWEYSFLYWHLYCRYTLNKINTIPLLFTHWKCGTDSKNFSPYYVRISQLHGGQMNERERNILTNSINRKEWD